MNTARDATGRPEISGEGFQASEFVADDDNGADYEILVDGYQYVFQDSGEGLQFIAFGRLRSDKLSGHPDLHQQTVPTEILDLFARSVLTPLDVSGDPFEPHHPIEMRGHVVASTGAQVVLIDDPERPSRNWKSAESIIRELCIGLAKLDVGAGESDPLPQTRVNQDNDTVWVVYDSIGTEHTFRFSVDRDGSTVWPEEMTQGGESYRSFEVPSFVREILAAEGFEVDER
jgi:hypothetical protein